MKDFLDEHKKRKLYKNKLYIINILKFYSLKDLLRK